MGKSNFSDEFKRDAVRKSLSVGIRKRRFLSGSVSVSIRCMLGSGNWRRWYLATQARMRRYVS